MNTAGLPAADHRNDALVRESWYKGEQADEYDLLLRSRPHFDAPYDYPGISALVPDIVTSGWHVPCYPIIFRTRERLVQAIHVVSNTNTRQDDVIREHARARARAILLYSDRSYFVPNEAKNLAKRGIAVDRVIPVGTDGRWRVLYDPVSNQLMVDDMKHQHLLVHRGFLDDADA